MTTKQYTLPQVLQISGKCLLTKIEDVYDILNWMTNDNLFTHQLPRACEECRPWLVRWFPELREASDLVDGMVGKAADTKDREHVQAAIDEAVSIAIAKHGCKATYDVPRIPRDDHEYINAITEAIQLVGEDRVVVVES